MFTPLNCTNIIKATKFYPYFKMIHKLNYNDNLSTHLTVEKGLNGNHSSVHSYYIEYK